MRSNYQKHKICTWSTLSCKFLFCCFARLIETVWFGRRPFRALTLYIELQSTPDNWNLQGKSKKVRVIGSWKKITGSKEKNSS